MNWIKIEEQEKKIVEEQQEKLTKIQIELEKLVKIQIEQIKKEQKKEELEKMLSFVSDLYKISEKNLNSTEKEIRKRLDGIDLGECLSFSKLKPFTLRDLMYGCYVDNSNGDLYDPCVFSQEEFIEKKNLERFSWSSKPGYKRKRYINILKEELPKILASDVFDTEKGELK